MALIQALPRPVFMQLSGFTEKDASAFLTTSSNEHVQVGSGTLGGEIGVMPLHRGSLRRVQFTLDMRFAATLQPDCINLIFAVRVTEGTRVSGLKVPAGSIVAMDEGTFTDSRLNAGTAWIGMRLPRGDFLRQWQARTSRDLPWRDGLVVASPQSGESAGLASTLKALETIARTRPDLFDEPLWRRNAERAIEERFLAGLQNGVDDDQATLRSSRRDVVRRADEFLAAALDPVCTVTDLCAALGMGRRSLERAFQETIGVGPKEYLQLRSLKAVREALLDPAMIGETVTSLAMQHGFWHLGRFSSVYSSHFGELPRDTRRNTMHQLQPARRAA